MKASKQHIMEIEVQHKSCMRSEKKANNQLIEANYAMHCNGLFLG
jgi:hypothetical protein